MSIEIEQVYTMVETMTPDAKDLYYFALKAIFERDEVALKDILDSKFLENKLGELSKAFMLLGNLCTEAAKVADAVIYKMSQAFETKYTCDLCCEVQTIVISGNYPIGWSKIRFGLAGADISTHYDICAKCNPYYIEDKVDSLKKNRFILWLLKMGAWTKQ